jgi:WD40 repeat protein
LSGCAEKEGLLLAGDKLGYVHLIAVHDFRIVNSRFAHPGTVQAIAAHPSKPIFAVLAKDRSISVWKVECDGTLTEIFRKSVRDLDPTDFRPIHSESQAIALHPILDRVATRTGSGAIAEFDYSARCGCGPLWCERIEGTGDVVSLAYASNGAMLMAGSNRGQVALMVEGRLVETLSFIHPDLSEPLDESIHWFEPHTDGHFLLACDGRYVIRFHPGAPQDAEYGPVLSRDDLEHVTFNSSTGRAWASSFDRNVYEFDPTNLKLIDSSIKANFKIRWIKSLRSSPETLVFQVRDGSLVKWDLSVGAAVQVIDDAPGALWTCDDDGSGNLVLSGSSGDLLTLHVKDADCYLRPPDVTLSRATIADASATYVKRLNVTENGRLVLLGCTDGFLRVVKGGVLVNKINCGSAIRDVASTRDGLTAFVGTEGGKVIEVDLLSFTQRDLFESNCPIWCIALSPNENLVAFGERVGRLIVLDRRAGNVAAETTCRLPKRMRWLDAETLFVTRSQKIDRIRRVDGEWIHEIGHVTSGANTIEDFDWDASKTYLVGVSYNKRIHLFDLHSGRELDSVHDDLDYSKGVRFLPRDGDGRSGPTRLVVYGRTPRIRILQIHDEQLVFSGSFNV